VRTSFRLVQGAHSDRADVACPVVARSNGCVLNGRGANEADFGIVVFIVRLL
jgi:hypothetical protein